MVGPLRRRQELLFILAGVVLLVSLVLVLSWLRFVCVYSGAGKARGESGERPRPPRDNPLGQSPFRSSGFGWVWFLSRRAKRESSCVLCCLVRFYPCLPACLPPHLLLVLHICSLI